MSKANPRFRRVNPQLPNLSTPVYQVTVSGSGEAGIWLINLAYLASASPQTNLSEQNIATTWNTQCNVSLKACLNQTYTYTGVKVTCVTNPNRIPYTGTGLTGMGSGTVLSSALPSTVAAIFSKYTTTKGQHGRGRNYMPAPPITFTTPASLPDYVNATGLTAYNSFLSAIQSASIVDGSTLMALCIYTRVAKGQPVTQGQFCSVVQMRSLLGTVRRRRTGRGK